MLKIRDDVDLKELEKFGFRYYSEQTSCYYGCCIYSNEKFTIFINNARRITLSPNSTRTILELDILYDIIQARISRKSLGGSYGGKYKDIRRNSK